MNVPVSEAKGQLTDLVRRAEAGEEVVLTRHGHPVARLVPATVRESGNREYRRRVMEDIRAAVKGKAAQGPSAARSQDFLYDEFGLPK
jgi:prevent-host-death family protein